MNNKIKQGIKEFENENYEKALAFFDLVRKDDCDYDLAQLYIYDCLLYLKRYREALGIMNSFVSKDSCSALFWYQKSRCHVLLKEYDAAGKALGEFERVVDRNDKEMLIDAARLYNIIGNSDKAVECCDMALAVDENYRAALYEKAIVASGSGDDAMIDDVSERIIAISDDDLLNLMPVFLLNLFSKKFESCFDVLNRAKKGKSDEQIQTFKNLLYNEMSEDLNAKILLCEPLDLSIDDAIGLMLEFENSGRDHGEIHGVEYYIL